MSAEAEKEPVKPASQESKSIPWSGILKAAAAIGTAVGGYLVHLSGSISHRNYVYEWGLDSGLFPLSTEATFIEGFYALIDRLAKIQTTIWSGGLAYRDCCCLAANRAAVCAPMDGPEIRKHLRAEATSVGVQMARRSFAKFHGLGNRRSRAAAPDCRSHSSHGRSSRICRDGGTRGGETGAGEISEGVRCRRSDALHGTAQRQ
ncbi:hypothetical protein [Variovorax sp. YR752]|uniref:hypothetical protein n=1 Tax=Variovorax sp. YR752 TaxID=1884383 RepID=UPI00117E1210|nr:hypothetical protein [Variovorax sp. YR752]